MLTIIFFLSSVVAFFLSGVNAAFYAALKVHSRSTLFAAAQESKHSVSISFFAHQLPQRAQSVKFLYIFWLIVALLLLSSGFDQVFGADSVTALFLALVSGSSFAFIFVEVYGVSLGQNFSLHVLRGLAFWVRIQSIMFTPFLACINWFVKKCVPAQHPSVSFSSEEQLLNIVDEATEDDLLEEDDRELIHSIFDFNETIVREIMVPRTDMVTLEAQVPLDQALEVFFASGTSRIPVIGSSPDDIVGILYLRDVVQHVFSSPGEARKKIGSYVKDVLFVPESQNIDSLLQEMQRNSVHLAIVIDEYGGVAGLVTLEDLLEELVGEIFDEYDKETFIVREVKPHFYHVSSRLSLNQLSELFDEDIDDEDVDSVGGMIAKALGRLPNIGDTVRLYGLEFHVLSKDRKHNRAMIVSVEQTRNMS